jgi:hypothetical protein
VTVFDDELLAFLALVGSEEGGFAHQFANKGRADSLGLVEQFEEQGVALRILFGALFRVCRIFWKKGYAVDVLIPVLYNLCIDGK